MNAANPALAVSAIEQQCRRIVRRWYPEAWTAVNGDALVGTLLDAAERREATSLPWRTRLNLAQHGLALRAIAALPKEVRSATASISAGAVAAYSVTLVVVGSWTPGNRVSAGGGPSPLLNLSHLLALTPFLVVWLLVAACAFLPRRRLALASLSAVAVVVTVVSSPLWFLDALVNPFASGWDSWWGSVQYAFPGSAVDILFLFCAGCAGFIGNARVKPFVAAAIGTVVVAIATLLLRIATVGFAWPAWIWSPARYPALGVMSTPVLAVVAVVALLLIKAGLRRWGLVLALSAVPSLLGWATALVFHPAVYIAF